MTSKLTAAFRRFVALAAGGSVLFLEGCDPTLRATVEDGLITASTSLFGALLRAGTELFGEVRDALTNDATAMITDTISQIVC
jgi:uncharacterized protein (DUF2236 family)